MKDIEFNDKPRQVDAGSARHIKNTYKQIAQMKTKNYVLVFFTMIFSTTLLRAQEHRIPVQNAKETTLSLLDFYDNLPIEGYAGNEIIITATSDRFDNTPEKAKGLKAVYPGGTDNTGIALEVSHEGNNIVVRCLMPITQHDGKYKLKVPEELALRIKSGCERDNSVDIQNMKGEIEVNICQTIKLKNVTGPLELSTISGDIDVVFGPMNAGKPISIANISGEIDVTLPAKAAVNLEMRNVSGNMYSDFDFNTEHKDMQRVGGNSINARLNGGGTELTLTNVSGNIYLRKG
jgi:lia operon protein LiaG